MIGQFKVRGEWIEIRPVDGQAIRVWMSEGRFPTLLELEHEYVQHVLAIVDGNRSQAARLLGIDRVSLWRKLKRMESVSQGGVSLLTPEKAD